LGVKGGNFVEEILSKVLSLKVLAKDHKQFESIFGKPEFLEYAYLCSSLICSAQHQKHISVGEASYQDSFDWLDVYSSLATIKRMPKYMQMMVQKKQVRKQKLVLEYDGVLISRHVLSVVASNLLNIYTGSLA